MAAALIRRRNTAGAQQLQLDVVRQIGRIKGIAQLAAQQAAQPAVVIGVENFDLLLMRKLGGGHSTPPCAPGRRHAGDV